MNEEEMAYQEALDYLYSFVDYSLTRAFRYSPEKFDLGRMEKLLARLDNPHRKYKVFHLAGTKGKGSTAAMIASALREAGYHVGFYTSPHMHDFAERIQVDGQSINHLDIVELVNQIKPHVAMIEHLTTFELTTALGFLYFAQQGVDIAVVEVGLGGRLDATNLVDPMVSVITSLSYDHMAVLGYTLSQIAAEKAGIIKPGRPVVLAPQKDEARQVVEKIAKERGASLTLLGRDYFYAPWSHSMESQSLLVWPVEAQQDINDFIELGERPGWKPPLLKIPLLGIHQVENAATAYVSLQIAIHQGLAISEEQIERGFSRVYWPGRFEVLRRDPPLIVDSAHNRDSALKLRLAIDDYLPGFPVLLLFGASEDKDVAGMFNELMPRVHRVIASESFHPRAMSAQKLVELSHQFGRPAQAVLPVEKALSMALDLAGTNTAVVATGSLFIAAAVREGWQKIEKEQKVRVEGI